MNKLKEKFPIILYAIIAFVCFYAFYTVSHPLYIYDTDDWTYISYSRHAVPMTSQWNPAKVLPETLMPLTAELGLRFVMPFTKDYIGAMAISFAVVISIFIIVYLLFYGKVIKHEFSLNNTYIVSLLIVLALLHFLPFNVNVTGNYYLFYCRNVNRYFNYLVSALVNAITVMYLMTHRKIEWKNQNQMIRNGILILALYLCINSNLFQSGILIAYVGMRLSLAIMETVKKKEFGRQRFSSVLWGLIRNNQFEIFLVSCWLISVVMEMQGGRAQMAGDTAKSLLMVSVKYFVESVVNMNRLFLLGTIIVLLFAFIMSRAELKGEQEGVDQIYRDIMIRLALCMGLEMIYLIILCAKVEPAYIKRPDVMVSWMFYLLLMEMISGAYILRKYSRFSMVLPILIYILVFEVVIDGKTYAENNLPNYSVKTVKALDENILRQVKEAEEAGYTYVDVLIPISENGDGGSMIVSYGGERIARTLFRHGLTEKEMEIRLIPDKSVNEEFHLSP